MIGLATHGYVGSSSSTPPGPLASAVVPMLEMLAVWISGQFVFDELDPTATAAPIFLPRGSDVTVLVTLLDLLNQPIELFPEGGDIIDLNVRQTVDGAPVLTSSGAKMAEAGRYLITLVPNDTIDLSGRYVYDVWVTRSGVEQQVVAPGYMEITPRMRVP